MNKFLYVLLAAFLLATSAIAQQGQAKNGERKDFCPKLEELSNSPSFINKFAAENGPGSTRFLFQEAPTIQSMLLAYAKKT